MHQQFQVEWNIGQEDISRFYQQNCSAQPPVERMKRFMSSIQFNSRRIEGEMPYPTEQHGADSHERLIEQLQKEEKRFIFSPNPPKQRSEQQLTNIFLFRKFFNKYHDLWIFISEPDHPARPHFQELYKEEKLRSTHDHLENIIPPQKVDICFSLAEAGLEIKLIFDYRSFEKYISNTSSFEKNKKILEVYVEESNIHGADRVIPSKKIKVLTNIVKFLKLHVAPQIQKSRKDIPYYNFVHLDSSPQLFTRRSIIQDFLCKRTQQEDLENIRLFYDQLQSETKDSHSKQILKMSKNSNGDSLHQQKKVQRKYQNFNELNENFFDKFTHYLTNCYPFSSQEKSLKAEIYSWIISIYCQESMIYPCLNNSIRFSFTKQKVKNMSTMVKCLYDGIRFYFTTKFREITYSRLYRGGRASFLEQRNFTEGKYVWNLGFMSTSRSKKLASEFKKTNSLNDNDEGILMIIDIPKLTTDIEYIEYQQGFWALDTIPEIKKKLFEQQQVLFNPLNLFEIKQWNFQKKELYLNYAPHLEILKKKNNKVPLTHQQLRLLRSIDKLNDKDYDKGMKLYEEGNPNAAVRYYEESQLAGQTLSLNQAKVYYDSLNKIGEFQKLQQIIDIQKEEAEIEQMEDHVNISPEEHTTLLNSLEICEAVNQFETAYNKAEKLQNSINQIAENTDLNPEYLFLEIKTLVEIARAKLNVNMTFESIKLVLQSLRILDELSNFHLCSKLYDFIMSLRTLKYEDLHKYNTLKYVLDAPLDSDIKKKSQLTRSRIKDIKLKYSSEIRQSAYIHESASCKQIHAEIQEQMTDLLEGRKMKTTEVSLENSMAKVYWDIKDINLQKKGISQEKYVEQREQLKQYRIEAYAFSNRYKEMLEFEEKALSILYETIYKTSLHIKPCLHNMKIFYEKYEDFVRVEAKNEGLSMRMATIIQKHGEILFEFGQLFEKNYQKAHHETPSGIIGMKKMREAEEIIKDMEAKSQKRKSILTYEKVLIKDGFEKQLKSVYLSSLSNRKTAASDSHRSSSTSLSSIERSSTYQDIIKLIEEKKAIQNSDKHYNQIVSHIDNATDLIQIENCSKDLGLQNSTYFERLKKCEKQFMEVQKLIQIEKKEKVYMRNLKMAHLYVLMAQNRFRLGIIQRSYQYLEASKKCLRYIFKGDGFEPYDNKKNKLDKKKLIFGNRTKVLGLKLESHLIAHYGEKQAITQLIEKLIKVRNFFQNEMNQPLNQAEICQSVGLLYGYLPTIAHELKTVNSFKKYMEESISIRSKFIGPFLIDNARIYTIMMEKFIHFKNGKLNKEIQLSYDNGLEIYGKIDYESDPQSFMFYTIHQTQYLFKDKKIPQVCKMYKLCFQKISKNQNRVWTLDLLKKVGEGGMIMVQCEPYKESGIKWLKFCLEELSKVEKFIDRQNISQKISKKTFNTQQLRIAIQKQLIKH